MSVTAVASPNMVYSIEGKSTTPAGSAGVIMT